MPWNKQDYPVSMKNLEPRVRHKAIEIANALLEDGYEEGRAIAIATAKAEEWDENHPDDQDNKIHVVPAESGWAIKQEGSSDYHSTYDTKAEAIDAAKEWSRKEHIQAIIHNQDGQIARSLRP
ncbi:hypothetical protein PAECIP112173_01899 [Paenibacillus sp. JJ-100]|uniref:DUF2188 domain-containing protein n=1 Tax=Paenibacillus sp. JJ-100 TaxID=2974896 RepID=UPI0022FF8CB2|nr:DUF2188 domain-containing protein [Paenibacillus sp. JJ-100]CAI6063845.1 hypothetical protein PAECIP112173_01899 [Paenibacillus sp. JJ-100]